ncbi:uncharacterized protein LY79DRAFT_573337 [Colletotrichum navitas]|uniref:Uncharacterized protein n=1 Tax=Colletotrichum navitas TaxID=681940 RepID=A0AAD8PJ99_9PEZI|nr:uncharacterized protein LY79DRAFT_573337 [Colletotrichum navitas]KAK1564268.1 hypothetical protein LY79DRAFT_573337 [Colletotrichum navitas]
MRGTMCCCWYDSALVVPRPSSLHFPYNPTPGAFLPPAKKPQNIESFLLLGLWMMHADQGYKTSA